MAAKWEVRIGREFDDEFDGLEADVKVELDALVEILEERGPDLGRPFVDRLRA